MFTKNEELLFIFILITFVFVVFVALIVGIVFLHSKKVNRLFREKLLREQRFEQELVQSQLEVSEEVRLHVARDLHDNIGTLSSLVKINLELMTVSTEPLQKQEYLSEAQSLVKVLISDVKQLSVSLNPDRITAQPLSQVVEQEVLRIRKLNRFLIDLTVTGEEWPIAANRQLIIYRLCQELLHNILKHANAYHVNIELAFGKDLLTITLADDGKGFDMNEKQVRQNGVDGSGLINLNKRVKLIGGTLYLDSAPGNGTRCIIQVPPSSTA